MVVAEDPGPDLQYAVFVLYLSPSTCSIDNPSLTLGFSTVSLSHYHPTLVHSSSKHSPPRHVLHQYRVRTPVPHLDRRQDSRRVSHATAGGVFAFYPDVAPAPRW